MSDNVERDATAASRRHAILDALHLGKFVGDPYACNRQDEAERQPEQMNETAMPVVVLPC